MNPVNLQIVMIGINIIAISYLLYLGKVHFVGTPVAGSIEVQHTDIVIIYKITFWQGFLHHTLRIVCVDPYLQKDSSLDFL